jgi:hypothetical protein
LYYYGSASIAIEKKKHSLSSQSRCNLLASEMAILAMTCHVFFRRIFSYSICFRVVRGKALEKDLTQYPLIFYVLFLGKEWLTEAR